MNAYELADELEDVDAKNYQEIAANMLRQQADRIAELEKENKDMQERMIVSEKELNHMRSFFGCDPAYYGMTNAEPFAYAWEYLNDWKFSKEQVAFPAMVGSPVLIPLYTTPQTKPLSDEEINKAFDYYCETDEGVLRFDYELRKEWKEKELQRWKDAFARAIEERHGIK